MTLKVAFAVPPLHDKGGVSVVVRDLLYGLQLEGVDVYVFSFGDTVSEKSEYIIPIINGTSLIQKKDFKAKYKNLTNRVKIDAFFANSFLTHRICREICVENLFLVIHQGGFLQYRSFFERVKKIFYAKLIYDGQNIVGVSSCVANEFTRRFKVRPKSLNYVYNAVDKNRIVKSSLEDVESLPSGDFILHAGRFDRVKRHDRLLRSFEKIRHEIKLVLLGDGPAVFFVKELIRELNLEDRVFLLGWKHNPYPYLKKAKLVVLSSDNEALPTVLIESLMLGTPVVSIDCMCGPSEILRGQLSQFLVPPDDEFLLSDAIDRALSDYPLIDGKYLSRFSPKRVSRKYIYLIKNTDSAGRLFC